MSKDPLVERWADLCFDLAKQPGVCTAGSRKILRNIQWSVPCLDDSLTLGYLGYKEATGTKMAQLKRYYWNEQSISRGVSDLEHRVMDMGGYGSVGITTHGKTKEGFTKHGFCIQAFTLTALPKKRTEVDIFYRTTEVVKKFGADLVFFRDVVLPEFNRALEVSPITQVNFHIANLSVHPMFFPILAITVSNWEERMLEIKKVDPKFYGSIIRWSYRCITDEQAKYKQAVRVGLAIKRELSPKRVRAIVRFLKREMK